MRSCIASSPPPDSESSEYLAAWDRSLRQSRRAQDFSVADLAFGSGEVAAMCIFLGVEVLEVYRSPAAFGAVARLLCDEVVEFSHLDARFIFEIEVVDRVGLVRQLY